MENRLQPICDGSGNTEEITGWSQCAAVFKDLEETKNGVTYLLQETGYKDGYTKDENTYSFEVVSNGKQGDEKILLADAG